MTYDVIFINSPPMQYVKQRGLGPYLLAREVKRHGFSAIVLDFIEFWTMDEFKQTIKNLIGPNTKVVGFSLTWARFGLLSEGQVFKYESETISDKLIGDYCSNGNLTEMLNAINGPKIVFGGSKASNVRSLLPLEKIDHIFVGYSETQFIDLLTERKIQNKIVEYDTKAHADHTGYDFAIAKAEFDETSLMSHNEVIPIECSRGCRFKCKFCSFPLIGMKSVAAYTKTKQTFRDELLRNYEMFGVTKYSIVDDTFNDTTEKVRLFAEVVDTLPFDIKFWSYLRAEVIVNNPEQIELLHQMGLAECFFGIETYCHEAGKQVGKGMDPNRIKEMLYHAKSVWKGDTNIIQGLIVGLPRETRKSMQDTIDWVSSDDCPADKSLLSPLVIQPKKLREKFNVNYVSEFDEKYSDYGYTFPNLDVMDIDTLGIKDIGPLLYWEKHDGSDIESFSDAVAIARQYQPIIDSKKPLYPISDFRDGSYCSVDSIRREYVEPFCYKYIHV